MINKGKIIDKKGMSFPPKKVWLKTFGCQMNYHDSERILVNLKELNYLETCKKDDADLIIFNSCAIRQLANSKLYSQIGEIKRLKKQNNNLIVGIGGCVSQLEGKELLKRFDCLDFAFGTDTIDQVNDIVFQILNGASKVFINELRDDIDYSIKTKITKNSPQAYVNIIKGCNNFCSYCIVPYARGREKSRRLFEIVEDVRSLVEKKGIQDVTLLGQNVNSFGREYNETLAQLILELDKIAGLKIVRYITGHPHYMSDELIAVHGSSKKLSRHLHLPVQSGSNTVLERMNRKYTVESYLELLEKLRQARSDIVISSDIIVGFPNETDKEFSETMDFLGKAQFDFIYSYLFSPRPGTKAAKIADALPNSVRRDRLHCLQKYQMQIQANLRKVLVGKTARILVDGHNILQGEKKWKGRTNCNRIVHFKSKSSKKSYQWHWVEVKITSSTALSCQGNLIEDYGRSYPDVVTRDSFI